MVADSADAETRDLADAKSRRAAMEQKAWDIMFQVSLLLVAGHGAVCSVVFQQALEHGRSLAFRDIGLGSLTLQHFPIAAPFLAGLVLAFLSLFAILNWIGTLSEAIMLFARQKGEAASLQRGPLRHFGMWTAEVTLSCAAFVLGVIMVLW